MADEVDKRLHDTERQQPTLPLTDKKTRDLRSLSSIKNMKKANKRRRKEETALLQDSSLEILPTAKRIKMDAQPVLPAEKSPHPAKVSTASTTEAPDQQHQSELASLIAPELLPRLIEDFQIVHINIISSSQIQAKVTKIIEILGRFSWTAPIKPYVVLLHAKGPVASKLITIAEIAKREIEKEAKWYQYNGLDHFMAAKRDKDDSAAAKSDREKFTAANGAGRRLGSSNEMDTSQDGDDTVGAFETMKSPLERALEGKPKVQAVPVLSTFLTRIRVPILKEKYGEQTNALT